MLAGRKAREAQPRRDAVEPRRELGVTSELGQRPMSSQERLLGHLLGLSRVTEHPERDTEHPMLVGPHHLLERRYLAGSKSAEKLRVGRSRLMHGKTIHRGESSEKRGPGPPGRRECVC